jgi:DNA invertase Pin-like site-specific DNA recombinase
MKVNGQPERWLVAARISYMTKDDLARGDDVINGLQTQDTRSTDWVHQEGDVVVHVARDRNLSGAVPPWERPELGPWLTDPFKVVQYDGIVAYDVSRLSREYSDLSWLRKWAEENHKKLYVIKERLRWPDSQDGALWDVAAERAHEERLEITERITREVDALRDAGKLVGRPPFGYISAGEKWDRYLAPTDDGRSYVPMIYQYCIEGWSLSKIAQWLNDRGLKPVSSESWWVKSVADIIRNPVYRGHRCERTIVPPDDVEEHGGKILRYRYGSAWVGTPHFQYGKTIHHCEPLVDAAVWKRANEALSSRPRRRGHTDFENRSMLAEALFCPFCEDSPMYRHRAPSGNHVYLYYRCAGRGSQRKSCGLMVRVEIVDAAVNQIMASTFDVPVQRPEIVYGNEAEVETELNHIRFELKQLAARELGREEEDRERARLRGEYDRVSKTKLTGDRVEVVETDDTYRSLWEALPTSERGPWLVEHGFRVTTDKKRVIVSQGTATATGELDKPKRASTVKDTGPVYHGICGCGCGAELYGSRRGKKKKWVSNAHRMRAAGKLGAEVRRKQNSPVGHS